VAPRGRRVALPVSHKSLARARLQSDFKIGSFPGSFQDLCVLCLSFVLRSPVLNTSYRNRCVFSGVWAGESEDDEVGGGEGDDYIHTCMLVFVCKEASLACTLKD
jgi:hypothetical protein